MTQPFLESRIEEIPKAKANPEPLEGTLPDGYRDCWDCDGGQIAWRDGYTSCATCGGTGYVLE